MELSEKMNQALLRAEVAEKLASKALDMAMDALIKVEAMKQSTHKVQYVHPWDEAMKDETPKEPIATTPDGEPEPKKISPFHAFSGFADRRQALDPNNGKEETPEVFWEDDT